MRAALIPERVEDVPVASAVAVADHEQQQHDEEVRRQRTVATEIACSTPKCRVPGGRENLGNEAKNCGRIETWALRLRRDFCAIHSDSLPGIHVWAALRGLPLSTRNHRSAPTFSHPLRALAR